MLLVAKSVMSIRSVGSGWAGTRILPTLSITLIAEIDASGIYSRVSKVVPTEE